MTGLGAAVPGAESALVRVVLFEDAPTQRAWLARDLSEAGLAVVDTAADETQMRRLLADPGRFDVAVLDISIGSSEDELTGFRIALWLRRHLPTIGVVMFTARDSESFALRLWQEHPDGLGYLVKHRTHDSVQVADAVRRVHAGLNAIDEVIQTAMLDVPSGSAPNALTPTELWTLRMMAEGNTSPAIAELAGLATVTINNRISAIFAKLGIEETSNTNKRVEAVVHYIRNLEKYRRIREIPPINWPPPQATLS